MASRLPATREKLARCHELLELLIEKERHPAKFDALVDATLGELRSITWVLQREIQERFPPLMSWYARKQVDMRSSRNNGLVWLRDARNVSTKERPTTVGTATHIRSIYIDRLPPKTGFAITGRGEAVWVRQDAEGREVRTHATEFDSEVRSRHFFVDPKPPTPFRIAGADLAHRDVLTVLKAYEAYLLALVLEAEHAAEAST